MSQIPWTDNQHTEQAELPALARIRTIKPEFPQSESMGRVSRDARLLFVLLWTQCDDAGRARGASRMLASTLFPYDDDAPASIDTWLDQLEREGCIVRYRISTDTYIQITNFLEHQKIDNPSKPKFPGPDDALAKPREPSIKIAQDQGSRKGSSTKDQGKDSASQTAQAAVPQANPITSPLDLKKELWLRGVEFLKTQGGLAERDARSVLGRWRKTYNELEILNALAAAEGAAASEPVPYITAVLSGKVAKNGNARQLGNGSSHPLGIFGQLLEEERARNASAASSGEAGSEIHH